MPTDEQRKALQEKIAQEIADIKDPVLAGALTKVLANLAAEYTSLAERNRKLILRFSWQTRRILAVLVVVSLALGALSLKLTADSSRLSQANSKRIHDERVARRSSILTGCREQNKRHNEAKAGIEAVVAKNPTKSRLSPARQKEQLDLFVNALSPSYLAGKGTLAERERRGCAQRLQKFSKS